MALAEVPEGFDPDLAPEIKRQIRRAIAMAIVLGGGSMAELARKITEYGQRNGTDCRVTKIGVQYWMRKANLLKERHWRAIEEITNMGVTRRYLRPDLFGTLTNEHLRRAEMLARRYEDAT